MYDWRHQRTLNTLGLELISFKGASVDLAWMGIDGLGGTISYNLGSLPVSNVPVLKYVSYLNLGYGVGVRTITLNPTTDNPKSDNRLIQGPVVYMKFNF